MVNYKRTVWACCSASVMQALVCNVTAIIFVCLQSMYGLGYSQLGLLVLVNFVSQVVVDLIVGKPMEKFGFRIFAYITPIVVLLGFIMFIITPFIFDNVMIGFIIATIIFAAAGGMLEVMLSPIVDNLPLGNNDKRMAMLHSCYGWGQVAVVVITTLLIFVMGENKWQIAVSIWLVLPLIVLGLFMRAPIINNRAVEGKQVVTNKDFLKKPYFLVALLAIAFGGAAEITMAQWASTFMQNAVAVPKIVGDMLAVATFALALALGRTLYGKYSKKINLSYVLIIGSSLAFVCYLLVALVNVKAIAIIACCVSGFAVSMLWPGTLVLCSSKYPYAGALMFAMLALGGDLGASIVPYIVGESADSLRTNSTIIAWAEASGVSVEQMGLKVSLLIGAIFVVLSIVCQVLLLIMSKRNKNDLINNQEKAYGEISAEA